MASIPMEYSLILAGAIFAVGLAGLLVRRNIFFMLMSVQIMLTAAGLAFVIAGSRWHQADGQVMLMFVLAMAGANLSVGLALVLRFLHSFKSVDIRAANDSQTSG